MSVTLPGYEEIQYEREIQPKGIIQDDTAHDFTSLARRLNRGFAAHVHTVLCEGGYGPTAPTTANDRAIIVDGSTSYATKFKGYVRHWGNTGRFKLHLYGKNVTAQVTIGGSSTLFGVVCTSTEQWHSGTATLVSGFTISADNEVEVEIEIKDNVGSGTSPYAWALRFIVEEMPLSTISELPDSTDAYTDFQRLDDDYEPPDAALDGWALQTISNNSLELQRARYRGSARFWPYEEKYEISSIYWRADGPWDYYAAPGETTVSVTIAGQATDESVEVVVLSEHERWNSDNLIDSTSTYYRGITFSTVLASVHTFEDIPIRSGSSGYVKNSIWILFRSAVDSTAEWYSPTVVDSWDTTGRRRIHETSSTNEWTTNESIKWPVGRYISVRQSSPTSVDGGDVQAVVDGMPPTQHYDLALNLGTFGLINESGIEVSPHPNWRRPPQFMTSFAGSSNSIATYKCGTLSIRSVWINGETRSAYDQTELYHRAAIDELPPASIVRDAIERLNTHTQYYTPIVGLSHTGEAWLKPRKKQGATYGHPMGRWTYGSTSSGSDNWTTIAVHSAPQSLASGAGVVCEQIRVNATFAVISADNYGENSVEIEWRARIVQDTAVSAASSSATVTATVPLLIGYERGEFESYSTAAMAAYGRSEETGADNNEYTHSYVQQLTVLNDLFSEPWFATPEMALVLSDYSGTWPAWIHVQVNLGGLFDNGWVVCVGSSVRYGMRR